MARNGSLYYRYRGYRRRRRKGRGMPRWLVALAGLGAVALIALAAGAGVSYGVYRSYADDFVPPDEHIGALSQGGVRYYDRNNVFLGEKLSSEQREPVPLSEMSLALIGATVAAEDASFWDNPGVNIKGLARAAWDNFAPPFISGQPGFLEGAGGSSITQQLVKNVYFTEEERAERSVERKLKETVYALKITQDYEKPQILEWYLNLINYGNQFYGAQAAARGYFDKDAKDLTLAEAATLAGIPRCPACYNPFTVPEEARLQRNVVLRRMYEEGYIGGVQLLQAGVEPLGLNPGRYEDIRAPHFVLHVVQPQLIAMFGEEALEYGGLKVYTTVDLELQAKAQAILEEKITAYEYSGGHNGAFVAIDPDTAQILAYIGSRDYNRDDIDGQNDMAGALNSPGSSFKPVVYLTAFMNLGWGPGTKILDTPFPMEFWDSDSPPRNPDGGFRGPLSARKSLGNSLNIPAVKTLMYAGKENVCAQAEKMGYTSIDCAQLGPSMAIGGVDLKLIDQVYAYTAFPNLGIQKGVDLPSSSRGLNPIAILRVEDRDGNVLYPHADGEPDQEGPVVQEQRVAPAAQAALINEILTDPNAHCITYGCGHLTIPGRTLAAKTGTSEPYEDCPGCIGETWVIGYTPQIVAGTWFGNADNTPMHSISSYNVSWETVRDFMIEYHADLPVEEFPKPEGLVKAKVCMPSGLRPSEDCPPGAITEEDWFAKETLPKKEDDWWKRARVDVCSGLLPGEGTPAGCTGTRYYLQIPEGLSAWERNQAHEWAARVGGIVGQVPEEETQAGDITIAITSPANGAQIIAGSEVTITGRADSSNFKSWRLEYSSAPWAAGWTRITRGNKPISDGTLGVWNTGGLAPGMYTIRLVVTDKRVGEIAVSVQVELTAAPVPTPVPTPAPTPEPTPTVEGGGQRPPGPPGR